MRVFKKGISLSSGSEPRWDKQTAEMLLEFTEWSQGFLPVEKALRQVVDVFGAVHGTISRVNTMSGSVRIVASSGAGGTHSEFEIEHSFAHPLAGDEITNLKSGSLVLLSQLDDTRSNRDPEIDAWMKKNYLTDIGVICLSHENNWVDFFELFFVEAPSGAWATACEWGAEAFARTYRVRRPGLVTEAMARCGNGSKESNNNGHLILAPENTSGLTRSEWRVCVLVSRGLTAKAVADEMGVATSTVRTHLRRIYDKTAMSSFHQLARQLVSLGEQNALHRGVQSKSA